MIRHLIHFSAKTRLNKNGIYRCRCGDLFLPVPVGKHHGLFIEMKSQKGRVTDNQEWFLSKTEGLGYKTAVCYSANEAIKTIQDYYDASH